MKLKLIDHTDKEWNKLYNSHGKENGAMTYSKELVKYQVPIWEDVLKSAGYKSVIIGTCRRLRAINVGSADIAVQYLHTVKYDNPCFEVELITESLSGQGVKKILFVTAYRQLAEILKYNGYEACFIPMTVDAEAIRESVTMPEEKQKNQVVYFGNLNNKKRESYNIVKKSLLRRRFKVDTITNNYLNNHKKLDGQHEAWQEVAKHEFGIGVGRAALEMGALGLKVIYSGYHHAGIATRDWEWYMQENHNFSGYGFGTSIPKNINFLHNSLIRTNDIKENLPRIRKIIDQSIYGIRK